MLPAGFTVPEGRVKPWGTAHAILCCKEVVHEPFAAINADDYYGKHAFTVLYDYLKTAQDGDMADFSMVGYLAKNTLTEHGLRCARHLRSQRTRASWWILWNGSKSSKHRKAPAIPRTTVKTFVHFSGDNLVSMNFFGFTRRFSRRWKRASPSFYAKRSKKTRSRASF
jgi:hypothetical protein